MKINDFKIGQRLFTGFGILLLLLSIVWYSGKSSIGKITHQLEIAKSVNTMLTDAQDAQASSLRYIIYDDDAFNTQISEEVAASIKNAEAAKKLMKSKENIAEADSAILSAQTYLKACDDYFSLDHKQDESGKKRGAAADLVLEEVVNIITYEMDQVIKKRYAASGQVPMRYVTTLYEMQDMRNILNRIDKLALRYSASVVPEEQDKLAKEWVGEIELLEKEMHNVENQVSNATVDAMVRRAEDELAVYKTEVENYRNINKQRRDVMGIQKSNAANTMRIAREVRDGVYNVIDNVEKSANVTLILVAIIAFAFGLLTAWYLTNGIVSPIKKFGEVLKSVANGDLTQKIDFDSKDEIGDMANDMRVMVDSLSTIVGQISSTTDTVASSSEELNVVSGEMKQGAQGTAEQSTNVASATEQMTTNINTMASAAEEMSVNANEVAGAAEQTSQNMNAVSSAVEEMSVSISQIAQDASQAREIAERANKSSGEATETMGTLSEAAKEIGNVTEVIKRIAEQTNLLALNATIEAASAGEAGKGFAVVANEIKELANQSAQAADDIAERISGVQNNTDNAVNVIGSVSEVITQIDTTVTNIAAAVEQQSRAVNDISANVTQASTGTQNIAGAIAEVAKGANDVSRNSGEASKGATSVSADITQIKNSADSAVKGASQVETSAGELSKLAGDLKEIVGKFTL